MRPAAPSLSSASGLRPASAFVVIGGVLGAVALWVLGLSARRHGREPDLVATDDKIPPAYSIGDSEGRVLAEFAPRFDLELSPRSMWQAHTPARMAEQISSVLGGEPPAAELLQRFLPDAKRGVIEVDAWDLSLRQANNVLRWLEGESGAPRIEGMWLSPLARSDATDRFRLYWRPVEVLSAEQRALQGVPSAAQWGRRLADGLERALRRPDEGEPRSAADRDARRSAVWSALVPKGYTRPLVGIPPERVFDLRELLEREGVAPWQMTISYGRERAYPCGEHELFGNWGFLREDQLEPAPREGLELLCDALIEGDAWSFLRYEPEVYAWKKDRNVRSREGRTSQFDSFVAASEPPLVRSTLDLGLQRHVRRALEELAAKHSPALVMAIALDVASGDVLAVDSVERFTVKPFAPVYHTFTPGSTMKVVTMATALEQRKITPGTLLDVGDGEYRMVNPATGKQRLIHEAKDAPTGTHSAEYFFAHSVNAAFAQIGTRVPAEPYRATLVELGYGALPGSGLGPERPGYLKELPWVFHLTHASVAFGHELTTTLWQHASALATVIRGGTWQPLRMVASVEQGGERHELPLAKPRRVFRQETCDQVRAMMELGAREGTGRDVRRDDVLMGTKTGTAQKVPGEVCLHLELAERARWEREGLAPTKARYQALKNAKKPHARSCYTSSMCVFGRLPDSSREIMVLVVAEEPSGSVHYGSKVAGPAAASILFEALGLTENGIPVREDSIAGFAPSSIDLGARTDEPWRPRAEVRR